MRPGDPKPTKPSGDAGIGLEQSWELVQVCPKVRPSYFYLLHCLNSMNAFWCQMVAQERRSPLMSRCSYSVQMEISGDARNPL
jgi:hypothetical protein